MSTSSRNQHPGPAACARPPNAGPSSDEDRAARVALTWLAEPGNHTVWSLVQQHGAPATLQQLLRGDLPESALKDSVQAKTGRVDPQRIAAAALHQAQRLGVRVVVPANDEWPTQINALATLELDAPGRVTQNVRPPLCLWVRGAWPLRETLDRSVAVVGARAATNLGDVSRLPRAAPHPPAGEAGHWRTAHPSGPRPRRRHRRAAALVSAVRWTSTSVRRCLRDRRLVAVRVPTVEPGLHGVRARRDGVVAGEGVGWLGH